MSQEAFAGSNILNHRDSSLLNWKAVREGYGSATSFFWIHGLKTSNLEDCRQARDISRQIMTKAKKEIHRCSGISSTNLKEIPSVGKCCSNKNRASEIFESIYRDQCNRKTKFSPKYGRTIKKEQKRACAICLDEMKRGTMASKHVFSGDCGHFFHLNCIQVWKEINLTCPICRQII
jgi:hypothetical protein